MDQNQRCERCGMPRAEWKGNGGNGFMRGNHRYCCDGCMTGSGCRCR